MPLSKEAVLKSLQKNTSCRFFAVLYCALVIWLPQVFLTRDAEKLIQLDKSSFDDLNPDRNQATGSHSLMPTPEGSWTELEGEKLENSWVHMKKI